MTHATTTLAAEHRQIVDEEEALAQRVREALGRLSSQAGRQQALRREALALRDTATTSNKIDRAALVGQLRDLRATEAAVGALSRPDSQHPYFAHLRVWTGRRERDVLLGEGTLLDTTSAVTVADWRAGGPMVRVYFNYDEGEEYALWIDGRELEGRLVARRTLGFDQGRLIRIDTGAAVLTRDGDGPWTAEGTPNADGRLSAAGAARAHALDPTRLDEAQRAAVEMEARRSLLVLGDAGCGKTTVALHRLAHQTTGDPPATESAERDAWVVVPERGLARLTRRLLDALGRPDTPVEVYDAWALARARQLIPGLPKRICRDAPAAVVRFKRHPALWRELPGYVEELGRELARGIDRTLATGDRVAALYREQPPTSLGERFDNAERELTRTSDDLPRREVRRVFRGVRQRLGRLHEDLALLLGDSRRLQQVIAASQGGLTVSMANEVVRHVRDQLLDPAPVTFAHVRKDRRTALDDRGLDAGTPASLAGSVDLEDCALLLALRRLTLGPSRSKHSRGRWLVVDEAQDLAAVELAAVADAQRPGGAVSVAGDPEQQIDPTLGFDGWKDVLAALALEDVERVTLETSYRCPASVTALAQPLRAGPCTAAPATPDASDAPVVWTRAAGDGPRAAQLVATLRGLFARDPHAQVAIIARTRQGAEACWAGLRLSNDIEARLVLDGHFPFTAGVDVTTVSQVKGLEFDYVVVPDATAGVYPDQPPARRQLYVALTRTVRQLWLLHDGPRTRLLQS